MKIVCQTVLLVLTLFPGYLFATDHIRFEKGQSSIDIRNSYKESLIKLALDVTVTDFGPYLFSTDAPIMNALQARKQLKNGGHRVNVFIAVTNHDWESETIAIKIPVRKGLLNYRLLLIHNESAPLFAPIQTIEQLKAFNAGLLFGWSITSVMEEIGFKVKRGSDYNGLFRMLDVRRFDFLLRGVNEIFGELAQRKDILKHVIIEPHLALYIPGASYIFVSPKYPRIAERLRVGLERLIADGRFDTLFHQYFDDAIERAKLNERHIIKLDMYSSQVTLPSGDDLWFTP